MGEGETLSLAGTDQGGSLTLHLLDAAQGHPVQTWSFNDCAKITIGRAADNDIVLADTQISRLHVELVHRDGKWSLVSHGRNGTQIGGAVVSEVALSDRVIFQLGSSGPSFQFVTTIDSVSGMRTIDLVDAFELDFLEVDEVRQTEEVQQIVETDVFRQIQEQARLLRKNSNSDED